ncbi:MAG: hypothetical protein AB7W16_24165 [Candidatus Obscuribacterales bacterium]
MSTVRIMKTLLDPMDLYTESDQFPNFLDLKMSSLRSEETEIELAKARLKDIERRPLNFVPWHPLIAERLIRPLHLAKYHHICGDFLSSIAMSGLAYEMATVLLYEAYIAVDGEDPYDDKFREYLVTGQYEKRGQAERLNGMRNFRDIPEIFISKGFKVSTRRNKYLHVLRMNGSAMEADSRSNLTEAISGLAQVIGTGATNEKGAVGLQLPVLERYLKLEGIIREEKS